MKIVFSDDAAHEYRTLQMLADKDPNAKELFFRLSAVLADIIKMPDINDSLIGKTEHHDRAEEGYLGGRLEGCIARNIDASNRLVACEINGVAVILCCIGHIGQYENLVIGLNEEKSVLQGKNLRLRLNMTVRFWQIWRIHAMTS